MSVNDPYDRNSDTRTRVEWMLKMLFDPSVTNWDTLTDWECRFVHQMETKHRAGYELTDAQLEKLEQIYEERQ